MCASHLEYQLQDGFVHNWLVAGPHATPVGNLEQFHGDDYKLQIAKYYHKAISDILEPPKELDSFYIGETEITWQYYHCLDDHFVDRSTFHHTCHYLRSWAYAQVVAPSAQEARFVLTTNGPADIWLNGHHVHRQEHFSHQDPKSVPFSAPLQEGSNEILVRFEEVAARECPYVMALQIAGLSVSYPVLLPTYIDNVQRRQLFERVFDYAYLDRDIDYGGSNTTVHWSEALTETAMSSFRLMDWRNRIYLEGQLTPKAGEKVEFGRQLTFDPGQYQLVIMPRPEEFYQSNVRYQRRLPLRVLPVAYSESLYGTYEDRKKEALRYASEQPDNLYAELAKLAMGRWASMDRKVIQNTMDSINARGDCSDFYLVGLLGALIRFSEGHAFSKQLTEALEECILGFKYWHDEPGNDSMCYTTENHSILFHTCEVLAGQLYPDRTFTNTGETGEWHRAKGERLALEWLYSRGSIGFTEWDSNCYFEEDLLALSHLADLAENDTISELAAVVMDKMFFTMALSSFKGVFGSTHGRTYAPMIKGGELEPTSGITRLMWGMGVWNQSIRGLVALASSNYELPTHIVAIATDLSQDIWDREQHAGVNKVTYRTADYMLCSAQDYAPGQKGYQQHIWQATLGPGAVVFVNHPPCASEEGAHRPNFWHGNYILPRVAQWKDALIAVHDLPQDDWMGFTHAYWPANRFDEYAISEGWAFSRKGSGYLAITAAQGIELTTSGDQAYRELRSYGSENTWLCLMGREADDGTFDEFKNRVLAASMDLQPRAVRFTSLRGQAISFGWNAPLIVDGEEIPLAGFKHYENPYCVADYPASQMDIQYDEYVLRLHLGTTVKHVQVDDAEV